jgi:hypothetical protein
MDRGIEVTPSLSRMTARQASVFEHLPGKYEYYSDYMSLSGIKAFQHLPKMDHTL